MLEKNINVNEKLEKCNGVKTFQGFFFFSNLKKLEKKLEKNLKNITAQFDDASSC